MNDAGGPNPDPAARARDTAAEPPVTARALLTVTLGGAAGSAARYGATRLVPELAGVPVAVLVVNVLGAFLLGLLVQLLAERVPATQARHQLRLLLGTGALGGFTTYSSLATGSAQLLTHGRPGVAAAYALGSVTLGVGAAHAGGLTGYRIWGPR